MHRKKAIIQCSAGEAGNLHSSCYAQKCPQKRMCILSHANVDLRTIFAGASSPAVMQKHFNWKSGQTSEKSALLMQSERSW